MRAVSRELINSLDVGERTIESAVFMIFNDYYDLCSCTTPAFSFGKSVFTGSQLVDNRVSTQDFMGQPRRMAIAIDANDPNSFFAYPDGTWYPYDDNTITPKAVTDLNLSYELHTQEAGWWSTNKSDANGNCDVTVNVDMSSTQSINAAFLVSDPNWGYVTACDFYVIHNGVKTLVSSVTSSNRYFMFCEFGAYYDADSIEVHITKWSRVDDYIKLIEFVPVDGFDVTDRVVKWEILEERNYANDAALPYGNSSKNKVTLELDNTDNAFFTRNMNSPFYRKLRVNTKFRVFAGMELPSGSVEWTNRGTFYAVGTFASSTSKATTSIEAWDLATRMDSTQFQAPIILSLGVSNPNSITQIIDYVVGAFNTSFGTNINIQDRMKFDDLGRYTSDWNNIFSFSNGITPYQGVAQAFLRQNTYWKIITTLSESILGWTNFSEEETLIVDTEFRSKRVYNALTNGNFDDPSGVSYGWTVEGNSALSFAEQRLVLDGTNSAKLYTYSQDTGMRQDVTEPLGLAGEYTFQANVVVSYGSLHVQVVGLDTNGLIRETYLDQVFSNTGAFSYGMIYQDFTVGGEYVSTISVRLRQNGTTAGLFYLDNIVVATRSAWSFVGSWSNAYFINTGFPTFTYDQINLQDVTDKSSADKIKNQIIIQGLPWLLGYSDNVYSYSGDNNLYYGSYGNGSYWETIGLFTDDGRILGNQTGVGLGQGKVYASYNGESYWATVVGNDADTALQGVTVSTTAVSGAWAAETLYYAATALNSVGESTLGPLTSFVASGTNAAQISMAFLQNTKRYRLYRSTSSFGAGSTNIPYIDIGVGTSYQIGWPSTTILVSTQVDNAGNPVIVFNDATNYSLTKTTPTVSTAIQPPVIYLNGPLQTTSGKVLSNISSAAPKVPFIVYPFAQTHQQQQTDKNSPLIGPGSYGSYNFTHSTQPLYVVTSPNVFTSFSIGTYQSPEGIQIHYDTYDKNFIFQTGSFLQLDVVNSIVTPIGGTLVFFNPSANAVQLQPQNISVSGAVLIQTGGVFGSYNDSYLVTQVGVQQYSYQNEFIQNQNLAYSLAQQIASKWNKDGKEFDVTVPYIFPMHLQIGDKVSIFDDISGLMGRQFIVVRILSTYDGGMTGTISCLATD